MQIKNIAAIIAFTGVAVASIPSCAVPCLHSASEYSGCAFGNFECACTNLHYIEHMTSCTKEKCSPQDQNNVKEFALKLCTNLGHTVNLPTREVHDEEVVATTTGTTSAIASSSSSSTQAVATPSASSAVVASTSARSCSSSIPAASSPAVFKGTATAVKVSGGAFVAAVLAMLTMA